MCYHKQNLRQAVEFDSREVVNVKRKIAAAILGAMLVCNFQASSVSAEIKTIEADGEYTMGDGLEENQGTAKERARKDAIRVAGEQACVFVESLSEVKNGKLTRDEVRTVSANVLEVISAPIRLEPSGDSIKFVCHITVTVDTDNVLLQLKQDRGKLDEQSRRIKELEEENARIRAEIERIKNDYKTADETERTRLREEVKKNERDFEVADLLEKATALMHKRDFDGAEKFILQAIQIAPKNAMAWNKRGDIYGSKSDYKKAVEYLNKAIEYKPDYADAWNTLGNVYDDLGDNNKAADCYRKATEFSRQALEGNPTEAKSWKELGIASLNLGRVYGNEFDNYDEILEYLTKAYELDPNDKEILSGLGWVHFFKKDYDKAIEYAQKALALDSNYVAAWSLFGQTYAAQENEAKALECLNKSVKIAPEDGNVWLSFGNMYYN